MTVSVFKASLLVVVLACQSPAPTSSPSATPAASEPLSTSSPSAVASPSPQLSPIAVPTPAYTPTASAASPSVPGNPTPPQQLTYRIAPGDTVVRIATLFQVDVEAILEMNHEDCIDLVSSGPGAIIVLPAEAVAPPDYQYPGPQDPHCLQASATDPVDAAAAFESIVDGPFSDVDEAIIAQQVGEAFDDSEAAQEWRAAALDSLQTCLEPGSINTSETVVDFCESAIGALIRAYELSGHLPFLSSASDVLSYAKRELDSTDFETLISRLRENFTTARSHEDLDSLAAPRPPCPTNRCRRLSLSA